MAVEARHRYVNPVADIPDIDDVTPSRWNDGHDIFGDPYAVPFLLGCTDEYADGQVHEVPYASQAEAEAGVDPYAVMSALRVAQAIAALGGGGGGVPSGTREDFQQTAAPDGWTKETDSAYNDASPRIITGTVSTGGTRAFSAVFGTTAVDTHALTTAELASHPHPDSFSVGNRALPMKFVGPGTGSFFSKAAPNPNSTPNLSHNHPLGGAVGAAGSNTPHAHDLDLRVKFADFIIAVKD